MSVVIVYVSRRDSAPYDVLTEERIEDRFDAWLDEHNLSYTVSLANGESMTFDASWVLKRDRIAYEQERDRWVTYDTPYTYMEMDAEMWWGGEHGSDEDKVARDQWIAREMGDE